MFFLFTSISSRPPLNMNICQDFYFLYREFRSPSYWGSYDGQRFLFAVYATFAPHRMGVRTTDGDI